MTLVKKLLLPAALALAPATGLAAPAAAAPIASGTSAAAPAAGLRATPVYDRGYDRDDYRYRRHHRHWRPYRYYYYGPRCHWSRYWHRTICR